MRTTLQKEFTLFEIRMISERLKYLMSFEMKAGTRYRIDQWAKNFQSCARDIESRNNEIILSFCVAGENSVRPDKIEVCQKELNEFFAMKDSIEFSHFKLEWIEDLVTTDLTILHQFMDEAIFEDLPVKQEVKSSIAAKHNKRTVRK